MKMNKLNDKLDLIYARIMGAKFLVQWIAMNFMIKSNMS